jgi:hypothetical protein
MIILSLPSEGPFFLQRQEPFLNPLLRFHPIDTVAFLHPANKYIPVTGNYIQVAFRQTAPPMPEGTAHLRPTGLQLIPFHLATLLSP